MPENRITRRETLRSVAQAGATVLASRGIAGAQGTAIQVLGKPVEIALTQVSPTTVRITVRPIQSGQPAAVPATGALVKDDWGKPVARFDSFAGSRNVKCGDLKVTLNASPLSFRIAAKDGRAVQELKLDPATGALSFQTGDSPVLGLGQGGPQFDKRGQLDQMRSGQGGYQLRTHGAKVPVQFLIGTNNWAMFVHQPFGAFDLTAAPGALKPANPEAGVVYDIFVIAAKDPAGVMAEYAKLTGLPEMPPLWSFGYQQSHRTLGPPEEIIEEARIFREKKLPCDMMIYLGTDFCPNGWNTHNGEFTWNEKAFPDPKGMIGQLHKLNFKVVLHTVIEGRKMTGTVKDPCTAAPLPSGRTPDNRWPPDRQVSCYWPVHKQLLDIGVDGWWPDQGDGLDNASRLARNRMYFEGHQMYRPNERVYHLHRNGYAGMARYAAFLWTGDTQSLWETLKQHVPIGVNTGLSGIPWWGADIAGFVPTQEFTGEYFVRWFQYAAFNPLFRSHGREWRLRTPWGWRVTEMNWFRETPSYKPDPKELTNPAVEPICKKYLELRYQMMPYLYSAVKETCETGLPVIRALWLHYPDDATAVARGDEYLYGRDMLVAPVVEKGATSRSVYLPKGAWYDFWTREKMEGGREITRKVDLETIPLYVRAGAIVPLGPIKQYTWEKVDGPLTLWVHPGADGAFTLYEDDGTSFDFKKGEFMKLNIAWNDRARQLTLRLASGSKMLAPATRDIVVKVAGEQTSKDVNFSGKPVSVKL
jgi:alpha-glucosidase/alpha-D-xyloside xylohydrolase